MKGRWKYLYSSLEILSKKNISITVLLVGQEKTKIDKIKNINFVFFWKSYR